MGKAWIFQGGWDGHEPALTSARFKAMLEKHGYCRRGPVRICGGSEDGALRIALEKVLD